MDKSANQHVMSYDRLQAVGVEYNHITCTVSQGKFEVKHLPPTFKIGQFEDQLLEIKGLIKAVDSMNLTTKARKEFLKKKIPYSLAFMKKSRKKNWTIRDFTKQTQE